ncbi:MAG: OmpA family protein [Polyangiales bacterium]
MSIRSKVVVACLALSLGACSSAMPPPELVSAREAYKRAEASSASRLKPADLHVAKEALDAAEAEYSESPGNRKVADLGYVALRKAEYAEAQGNAAAAMEKKALIDAETTKTRSEMLETSQKKLKGLQGEVAKSQAEVQKSQAEIEKQKGETEKERIARLQAESERIKAEKKAQDAMDALAKSLAVKNEERGMVITLSGSVLFPTGQSTLLPGAQVQLDKVADALKTQTERHFVVEGHTDTQGTESANQILSQKRAEAVREYLIVHGVAPDSISAVGKGQLQPIADNKTVEGRAMNRRVEIVIQKQ